MAIKMYVPFPFFGFRVVFGVQGDFVNKIKDYLPHFIHIIFTQYFLKPIKLSLNGFISKFVKSFNPHFNVLISTSMDMERFHRKPRKRMDAVKVQEKKE